VFFQQPRAVDIRWNKKLGTVKIYERKLDASVGWIIYYDR